MPEFSRTKNQATIVSVPLIDAADGRTYFTGTAWGSLTNASIDAVSFSDTEIPASHSITNILVEAGAGEWYLVLPQADMNPDSGDHDYINIKFNADEIDEQTIVLNLNPNPGDVKTVVDAIKLVTDLIPDAGAMTSIAQASVANAIKLVTDLIPDLGAMTSIAQESTAAAIKLVTDMLPDAGALTSLAQELTVAKDSTVAKNATVAQESTLNAGVTDIRSDIAGIVDGTNPTDIWNHIIDGVSALIVLKRTNAYVHGKINRVGTTYSYRDENDTEDIIINNLDNDGRNL